MAWKQDGRRFYDEQELRKLKPGTVVVSYDWMPPDPSRDLYGENVSRGWFRKKKTDERKPARRGSYFKKTVWVKGTISDSIYRLDGDTDVQERSNVGHWLFTGCQLSLLGRISKDELHSMEDRARV